MQKIISRIVSVAVIVGVAVMSAFGAAPAMAVSEASAGDVVVPGVPLAGGAEGALVSAPGDVVFDRVAGDVAAVANDVFATSAVAVVRPQVVAETSTSILPADWCVGMLLMLVLNVLVYGLGVAAVLGTIIAGVLYMTARDSEQQVMVAKRRLYEIIVGLVAWALMYGLLNWLIPGGLSIDEKALCPDTSTSSVVTEETTACLL